MRDQAPASTGRLVSAFSVPAFGALFGALLVAGGCAEETTVIEGQLGRAIPLASGDNLRVPRLLIKREGCPGSADGCSEICDDLPSRCPPDACMAVVLDSSAPTTALAIDAESVSAERGCLEIRAAEDAFADPVDSADLAATVARFRFSELPMARVPGDNSVWGWRVGYEVANSYVAGILGGNLLQQLAVRFVHRRGEEYSVSFYREFPGSEAALADQGRAFIPLQFPGDLLGKEITDFCEAGGESCDFLGLRYDQDRVQSLVQPTQMVVDACLVPPLGTVAFDDVSRSCKVAEGPDLPASEYVTPTGRVGEPLCRSTTLDLSESQRDRGGRTASLVIATGIPGLVLFEDSARRFLGDLDALPDCTPEEGSIGDVGVDAIACRQGQVGQLYAPGWPAAGSASQPLMRLRIRSLGLVPGLTETSGLPPCQRLERRLAGLKAQCEGVARERAPYPESDTICAEAATTSAVILGEVELRDPDTGSNTRGWLSTLVVPADHPLAIAIRRDVVPEALQPDGLLGTALLNETDTILDYTDDTPGVRVACNDPGAGTCLALPACTRSSGAVAPRCCHGLPENLVVELVADLGIYGCCSALSEGVRRELNCTAVAEGREEPCPDSPCE